MQTISVRTMIDCPLGDVFAYIDDPSAAADWMPNLIGVEDIIGHGVGQQHTWTHRIAGLLLRQHCVVIDHIPNARRIVQSLGGVESNWTFELEQAAHGTWLRIGVERVFPVPLVGRLAERAFGRRSQHDLILAAKNIRARCEAASLRYN